MKFMEIKIVPGILEKDRDVFKDKLLKAKEFSETVFVDIIDGKFAKNETVGIKELNEFSGQIGYYVQLMTREPIEYLNECVEAEASLILGHIELMRSQKEFVKKGKELEVNIGLALDLDTPVDFLEDSLLKEVDKILLMAVPAGFSGQKFDRKVLSKIGKLRQSGFKKDIFVDGGINEKTISECVRVGANAFSVTSAIWKAEKPEEMLKKLRRVAEKAARR